MSRTHSLLSFLGLIFGALILGAPFAQAQRPLGTDVSGFQPSINWTTVKNGGVVFAWAKATEGTYYINPDFTSQEAGAKSVGIYIGAYHFARPSVDTNITGAFSADSEANYFWSEAGNYVKAGGGYCVPMLDWEDPYATNGYTVFNGFTTAYLSQWVNEWCTAVSNHAAASGIILRPVVYTGTWYSTAHNSPGLFPGLNSTVTNWPDWIAAYPVNANAQTGSPGGTTPWPSWNIWQYGDTNWSGGDADVYNGNLSDFLQTFVIGGTNAPSFVSSPTNLTVLQGAGATFYAKASGQSPLSFQWFFNGNVIPGATSSNYTLVGAQPTNAGNYSVTASNSYAKVSSAMASLQVLGPLLNGPNSPLDPSGMVNWWTGDGNGYDIYSQTNLTPNGGLTYTNGEVGMAFRFDGSSAYLAGSGGRIAPGWTICLWVYRQNAPGVSAALMGDGTYALKLEQYNATREVGISQSGVADYLFSPAYSVPVNKWTHLAFVATSTTVTLYTNGVLEGSVTAANFNLPRSDIGVDTFAGSPDDYMLGVLDELQVYNRALSAPEIASIYSAGSAGLVRAPQFITVTNTGYAQNQFHLVGQTGKAITLLTSTDLVNWAFFGTLTNSSGASTFIDSTAFSPQKFYKATQKY